MSPRPGSWAFVDAVTSKAKDAADPRSSVSVRWTARARFAPRRRSPPPRSGSGGRSGGIPLTRPGRGSVGLGRSSSGALALDGAAVSPWSRQQGSGVGRAHAASQTRHDVGEVLNGVDPRDAAGAEDRVRNRRAPPTGV